MTPMNKTHLFSLALVLATSTTAQTRRRLASSQPTRTQSALVEMVKLRNGRSIRLSDDMTDEVMHFSMLAVPAGITVNFKASVITNGGDEKPVARRDFFVFKEDIEPTLTAVNDRDGNPLNIFSFHLADEYRELDEGCVFNAALAKLKSITVATFATDSQGNATIQLPYDYATYFIYGSTQRVGRSSCWWYREITLSNKTNLIFDNKNAAYCG